MVIFEHLFDWNINFLFSVYWEIEQKNYLNSRSVHSICYINCQLLGKLMLSNSQSSFETRGRSKFLHVEYWPSEFGDQRMLLPV